MAYNNLIYLRLNGVYHFRGISFLSNARLLLYDKVKGIVTKQSSRKVIRAQSKHALIGAFELFYLDQTRTYFVFTLWKKIRHRVVQ
jgi:hypothetical protein